MFEKIAAKLFNRKVGKMSTIVAFVALGCAIG